MTLYRKTFETFDQNFIAYSVMAVIAQSCMGAIAAMYILMNGTSVLQMIQLAIVVLTCILVNTSVLAQAKPKLVFDSTLASILFSIIFTIANLVL